eukprot:scaffold319577_cov30-Tisochrysis_lutea.AAC.1
MPMVEKVMAWRTILGTHSFDEDADETRRASISCDMNLEVCQSARRVANPRRLRAMRRRVLANVN